MSIEMRDANPRRLNAANLRCCLGENFLIIDPRRKRPRSKSFQPIAKPAAASQRGKFICRQHRFAIDQYHVAPDAQSQNTVCQFHRVGKRRPFGHQRGGGHDPARVRFHDCAIHACGKPEVVRVDD